MPLLSRLVSLAVFALIASPLTAQQGPTRPSRPSTTAKTSKAKGPAISVAPKSKILMDPAVTVGKLPNGLRYYIRRNDLPAERAELRLVVNAGSILEDADQLGMAHFVEHMAFNGTTHFPKNELIRYLESIGMQFGADLNAHTNYDETTYELTVPSDTATLHRGLTILEDWAHGIQFDSANVVAERKVILEEWRLRSGAGLRMKLAHDSVLYKGTPYPSRLPIGTVESITSTNPAALKRFYHDWYRPDLMTVIAVGDFDQAAMVREITRRFGAFTMPAHPRPRPAIDVSLPAVPTVSIVSNPEMGAWSIGAYFHKPKSTDPRGSVAAFQTARVENIFYAIVNQRLGQMEQKADVPVLSAAVGTDQLQRGDHVYTLSITSKAGKVDSAMTAALSEIQRIARDGVTPAELDAQKAILLRQADEALARSDAQQSASLAAQYMMNALRGNVSLSPMQVSTLMKAVVPRITPQAVRTIAVAIRADTAPALAASIPAADSTLRPTRESMLAAVAAVKTAVIPPYDVTKMTVPLLPTPPTPGTITATRTIPSIGVTEWTLSNGVRVLLKPVDNGDDKLFIAATRPGGYALADSGSYASAVVAANLLGAGGVGTYSNAAIRDKFPGVIAGAGTFIGDFTEGVQGQSGPRATDRALLFQLLYLKFTAPRVDSAVFARWKAEAVHPAQVDQQVLLLAQFMRNGNAFGRPVMGRLADSVDIGQALSFYRSRFADASGFTFVITGAFAPDEIKPLVEQYLGGLPSAGGTPATRDLGLRPTPGPVRHFLLTGNVDPQAKTIVVYTIGAPATRENNARVQVLAAALQQRLTFTLRQKLGGVYTVGVAGGVGASPYQRVQLQIEYTADPARLDELRAALQTELDSIKITGPTASELHDALEAMRRSREVATARADTWLQQLVSYVSNDWPLDGLAPTAAVAPTAAEVAQLAGEVITDVNRIEVVAMPQKFYHPPGEAPAPQGR